MVTKYRNLLVHEECGSPSLVVQTAKDRKAAPLGGKNTNTFVFGISSEDYISISNAAAVVAAAA